MKRKGGAVLFISILLCSILLSGCKTQRNDVKKIRDLDFTVVQEQDIPEKLAGMIAEKKEKPFKLSYTTPEYLYIVVGYGQQATGGYSITVNELYETKNAIYIQTTLIGPSKDEQVTEALTYPYIVVKTELIDKSIVFE